MNILNPLKHVLVYYAAIIQFSIFFQKLPVTPLIFWSTTKFFTKIFLDPPPTILEDEVYVMTLLNQLAPKRITNLQTMTA